MQSFDIHTNPYTVFCSILFVPAIVCLSVGYRGPEFFVVQGVAILFMVSFIYICVNTPAPCGWWIPRPRVAILPPSKQRQIRGA